MSVRSERGQGFVEYGLLIIIVAVALIVLLTVFGGQISNTYSNIIASI